MRHMSTFLLFFSFCLAIGTHLKATTPDEKMKGFILRGQEFWFLIREPDGWNVNIDDAAKRQLNAYFVMNGYSYASTPALIYVRVMNKQ